MEPRDESEAECPTEAGTVVTTVLIGTTRTPDSMAAELPVPPLVS